MLRTFWNRYASYPTQSPRSKIEDTDSGEKQEEVEGQKNDDGQMKIDELRKTFSKLTSLLTNTKITFC